MSKPPKAPSEAYSVGYGKPPANNRFKQGQTGNPKGRPKGQSTFSDLIAKEAAKIIKIQTGDKVTKLSKLEAIVKKTFQLGASGNLVAVQLILKSLASSEADLAAELTSALGNIPDYVLDTIPDDDAIEGILARLAKTHPANKKG